MPPHSEEDDRRSWRYEPLTPDLVLGARVSRVLYSGHTAYQQVEVLETPGLGRCLVLDGKTQSAEADEFIYHEGLVHPALVAHPRPEYVCVLGGGEGATVREVLRHNTVRHVGMVDLDQEVVEVCRQFLPTLHQGAFDDPRLRIHYSDAGAFFDTCTDLFDVLVLDLADPTEGGPATMLYTRRFYETLRARLRPGGLLVTQAGPASLVNHQEVFTAICYTLRQVFPLVAPYAIPVQSFGETWGFVLASLGPSPLGMTASQVDDCLAARGVSGLRFYDGEAHPGLFSLPRFLRRALEDEDRVITEERPLFVY